MARPSAEDCPSKKNHTKNPPKEMVVWTAWAEQMLDKGYDQKQCPDCGKYVIWEKRIDNDNS